MISHESTAVFSRLNSGGVILNADSGAYFQLNPTGCVIWEAIGDGTGRESLVERLVEEFDIDRELAACDVDYFLGELHDRSLIRIQD